MKEIKFENYKNMIDKRAWEVSKRTGVDFEELQAQGAFIYCYVLKRYDSTKSSFATILYLSLGRLNEYAYYFKDRNRDGDLDEKVESLIEAKMELPAIKDILELAKERLQADSYRLFDWLLNRDWEFQGKKKPCVSMAVKKFGWNRDYAKVVWNDCKSFWNDYGWKLYC